MINTSFIHACDDICMLESAYDINAKEIHELAGTLDVLTQQKRDLQAFGIFTESKEEYFTEGVSNVIETLGKKILEIIQHFKDTMSDIFRKWKERSWQKKDDVQKLREIEKRDPKAAAKLQIAIEKGDLDMNSYKDIDAFFKDIDGILDDIDKANVDPKSLKGRLNKAKEKLEKNDKTVKAVAAALGLVATAGTIVVTYQKFKQNTDAKARSEGENINAQANNRIARINAEVEVLKEMEKKGDSYAGSKMAILADLANETDKLTCVNVNKRMQLVRKAESKFFVKMKSIHPGNDKEVIQGLIASRNSERDRLDNVKTHAMRDHYKDLNPGGRTLSKNTP